MNGESLYNKDILIEENIVYDNHHTSIDIQNSYYSNQGYGFIIRYNKVYDTDNSYGRKNIGIQTNGTYWNSFINDIQIYYNVIYNTRGSGINIAAYSKNIKVYNNTVYIGVDNTEAIGKSSTVYCGKFEFFNNIGVLDSYNEYYSPADYRYNATLEYSNYGDFNIWFGGSSGRVHVEYNNGYQEFFSNISSFRANTDFGDHSSFTINPAFVDVDNGDFHLPIWQMFSGVNKGDQSRDIDGNSVGSPRIGAYGINSLGKKANNKKNVVNSDSELPTEFAMEQNYPNPFNPTTVINYSVAKVTNVNIEVFNSLGQKVKTLVNAEQSVGNYSVDWNGTDVNNNKVSTGIYFYKINAGQFVETRKMLLMK